MIFNFVFKFLILKYSSITGQVRELNFIAFSDNFRQMKFPSIQTAEDFTRHFRNEFWRELAETVCRRHSVSFNNLRRIEHGENVVFLVDERFVLKFFTPFKNGFRRERIALEFASGKSFINIPEVLFAGKIEAFDYLITNQFTGVSMTRENWLRLKNAQQIKFVSHLAAGLKELHSHDADSFDFDWQKFVERQVATVFERQKTGGANAEWLERLPVYLEENLKLLPKNRKDVFLHGDVHFGNLRVTETSGKWKICGLFDFADSLKGFHEYEFVAVGVLMIQGQGELQREFFRAYGYKDSDLDEDFRRRLMLLTILYEWSSLHRYALRLKPEAVNFTLDRLERAIWNFI